MERVGERAVVLGRCRWDLVERLEAEAHGKRKSAMDRYGPSSSMAASCVTCSDVALDLDLDLDLDIVWYCRQSKFLAIFLE